MEEIALQTHPNFTSKNKKLRVLGELYGQVNGGREREDGEKRGERYGEKERV